MSRCANQPPTPRQLELLLLLRRWWAEYDCAPSLNDLSRGMGGISNSAVDNKLRSLLHRGLVLQVFQPVTGRGRGWRLSAAGEMLCSRQAGEPRALPAQPFVAEMTLVNRRLLERERALARRYEQLRCDRDARAFLGWLDRHVAEARTS